MKTNLFSKINTSSSYLDESDRATIKGVILKTLLLLLLVATSSIMIFIFLPDMLSEGKNITAFIILMIISSVVALICGIAGRFDTRATKYLAVIFALAEGLTVGYLTKIAEFFVPGAGIIALGATLIIFGVMFTLYAFGVLRASKKLVGISIALLIGALALTIVSIFAYFMADDHTYFVICIILEAILLVDGVITLTFNFQEVDSIVNAGCSKNSEWCASLGLCISIVFIYIEIIRLIIYIAADNRS